ncbi:hypothetical protein P152DRAFT_145483 [Eremomyces bilateralis CBS 781.70]|uniref:Xylanolytic transcriptional activator regulatory domain-containing protein n=1 Tax=Eremomyces bilateralis CBS 781.70 TaxID=1392243 RepID=A0A6G1FWC8_9PEZI|nr:uncharacterized protein P152DRAFT_145483 [Eremomyces bilateralis CBS 781.70]KAF1809996.1 hypothetical protein P152DRAFT_145483 [Eremomyces bilateralis CBS 781.70]
MVSNGSTVSNEAPMTFTSDSITRVQNLLSPSVARKVEIYSATDIWNLLPPHEELMQGCRVFLTTCLQVGFIPKALFLEQMTNDRDSVNAFLLLSMLGISARFAPELCQRFGSSQGASEFFIDIAHVMIADEMWKPSLENTQAFFLLGMADWGRADRERSAINMGIAVRMAGLLRLHREETYILPQGASADEVVNKERARRTFWVIQNHDNLYTQQHLPVSFAKSDITTLLPGEENDFAFGRVPPERAALEGTSPAQRKRSLTSLPTRSLFATLIQAHDLWGMIARDAYGDTHDSPTLDSNPWEPNCHYQRISETLRDWEDNIPVQHRWSAWNLRGYKAEHVDLAYLSIITITRLNNIVLRRTYLKSIVAQLLPSPSRSDPALAKFWEQMSHELFTNVADLYEAIDVWFCLRSADDGFPAMLAFCTYICGSLACYVYKWPRLCPSVASSAAKIVHRSLEVLSTFEDKWPTASEWVDILRKVINRPPSQGSPLLNEVSTHEALLSASVGHSPDATRSPQAQRNEQPPEMDHNIHHETAPRRHGSTANMYGEVNDTTQQPAHDGFQGPHNYTDNLRLLSDAAAHGTYLHNHTAVDSRTAHPSQQTIDGSEAFAGYHEDGFGTLPSPESTTAALLREPFDNDFADIVQGYVNLGWTGWRP